MSRGRFQTPLASTLGFSLVVVGLLVAGGIFVRSIVGASFRDAERIRTARVHVADMLRQQLDEETGVRGYSAVPNPILLAPYYDGRAKLPASFNRVRLDIEDLQLIHALRPLRDAVNTNRNWLHQVAFPLIFVRGKHTRLELHGKVLVDRFRYDALAIDAALARRAAFLDARAQVAVLWVGGFALGATLAVVSAALVFTVQQYRLGVRLERERAESEQERRKSAEIRAAYETEKRIADTLQEALSERLFPPLPRVSFSATYVPATEETKIGGDWYDALPLSEGRVFLAIGDVTGHGIEAAVAMNKARLLLISCALLDTDPGEVLQRTNFELVSRQSPIITAVSALLDTRTYEFAYAAAGHPPPVLVEPGRRARLLKCGSLPLGILPTSNYQTHRLQTVPGAMIVLYTDGVVEYSRDLPAGEAALLEAVESAAELPKGQVAKAIRESIFRRGEIADDVAILTIRLWDAPGDASLTGEVGETTFAAGVRTGKVFASEPSALRRIA